MPYTEMAEKSDGVLKAVENVVGYNCFLTTYLLMM